MALTHDLELPSFIVATLIRLGYKSYMRLGKSWPGQAPCD